MTPGAPDLTPPDAGPPDRAGRTMPRVLVVELGGPDPAAVALGRVLRDEGMEVVHAGPLDTAEQVLRIAEQEDPDAVGVLGGAPSEDLETKLGGVRVFRLGAPGDAENGVFETVEEAAKWLLGGRSHTAGPPSDRVR
jgi:methylmalonyl-CoA mutase C-terminal domain/subunit